MKEKHITTLKTARYYVVGDLTTETNEVWIVFHGYGQPASEVLKPFEQFVNDNKVFIAPEGLSRFYRKGFFGQVGAIWMTKEDRLSEIKDYLMYINNLYQKISSELNLAEVSFNLLGFSQGAATAFRVFEDNKFKVDNVVLFCSPPPVDSDFKKIRIHSGSTSIKVLAGRNDKLVELSKMKEGIKPMLENKVKYDFIEFEGGHEIPIKVLNKYVL